MKHIYLYADERSRTVLEDDCEKIILVGGDFGYGNFGDVLQHLNSIRIAKTSRRLATVSVLAAHAMGRRDFPEWAQQAYGTDALVFVSEFPLIFQEGWPNLELVRTIRNPSMLQLYGGGFLNDNWGEFVLWVVESLLRALPGVPYFVSGQQVTFPYERRVIQHIKEYRPVIFGVRDVVSRQLLRDAGFDPAFSFDDASEALLALSGKMQVKRGGGMLLHLNLSDYTAGARDSAYVRYELERLAQHACARRGVTVLQAFLDSRQEVKDSRESIKLADSFFPFCEYRILELVPLAFGAFTNGGDVSVRGELGCSSSYHVALWLQLSGIPCWLRSRNPFYDQKARALQVVQDLDSFLAQPRLADHSLNLEKREEWLASFNHALAEVPSNRANFVLEYSEEGPQPWKFFPKGLPSVEEKLQAQVERTACAQDEIRTLNEKIELLIAQAGREATAAAEVGRELNDRVNTLTAQLTEVGHYGHRERERADAAEAQVRGAQDEIRNLNEKIELLSAQAGREATAAAEVGRELNDRVNALTAQLTEVGHYGHRERERADAAEAQVRGAQAEIGYLTGRLDELTARLTAMSRQLDQVLQSRSWRVTKPVRAFARYVKHGHFDARGQVGLFGSLQFVGRRLPLPNRVRRRIGRLLSTFRRQGQRGL